MCGRFTQLFTWEELYHLSRTLLRPISAPRGNADRPYSLPSGGTQRLLLEAMLENGTAPQMVYAYCRTGFAVFDKNRTALPPDRLFRWDTAINEYLAFGAKAKHVQH
jgi:hypothetical protein